MSSKPNLLMRCLRKVCVNIWRFLLVIMYVSFTIIFIQKITNGERLSELLQDIGFFLGLWSFFICFTLIRLHFDRHLKKQTIEHATLDTLIFVSPLPQRWLFDISAFRGALYYGCILLVMRGKQSPFPLQQFIMKNPNFYNNIRKADKIIVLVFIGLMIISVCLFFTGLVLSKIS